MPRSFGERARRSAQFERAGGIRAIITLVDRVRILRPEVPSVMAALSLGGATVDAINAVEGAA